MSTLNDRSVDICHRFKPKYASYKRQASRRKEDGCSLLDMTYC